MPDHEHRAVVEGSSIHTPRLILRPWEAGDAEAALVIYGSVDVARWMTPEMKRVPDVSAMRAVLLHWVSAYESLDPPQGRWAVELQDTGELVGGVTLLPMPPHGIDLEIGWQLTPSVWGQGLASEAGHAVARQAFESGVDEIFAVVRPENDRGAATARRVGMEWVGETDKYYDLRLQVYRLRKGEIDVPKLGSTSI
jgi:RimJ/RimL family protein N-acetyltransferase